MSGAEQCVRVASESDADEIARLLREFNAEYDEPAPDQLWLSGRVADLLRSGDTGVLLLTVPSGGLALLRFRPSVWEPALECYLAELYVRLDLRGQGWGSRLLTAAMDHAADRGATYMDLTTTNQDEAAVALYERMGFDRHERRGPGTDSYYFEIDLPRAGYVTPAARSPRPEE